MFIERLVISSVDGVLRDIRFGLGLNLVVDETPTSPDSKETGNNVGKTTVLRLIDFCLGGPARAIYADPESKSGTYTAVKDFLEEKQVEVSLSLVDGLSNLHPRRVVVRRNFLRGKRCVRQIDGVQYKSTEFLDALSSAIFPALKIGEKPTFRQAIAHNVRIDEPRLSHTLLVLNQNTRGVEYEALFLFMLGCEREGSSQKQKLSDQLRSEDAFLKKLSPEKDEGYYEAALEVLDREIAEREARRTKLGVTDGFADLVAESDSLSVDIARLRSELSKVDIRIKLIGDAEASLQSAKSSVDVEELRALYQEASSLLPSLQRSFEELVSFHNGMLDERIRFIKSGLPELQSQRDSITARLEACVSRDHEVTAQLSQSVTSQEAEVLIAETNERYRQKGELQGVLEQLKASRQRIAEYKSAIEVIDAKGEEAGLQERIHDRLAILNGEFGRMSDQLYGETYFVRAVHNTDKAGVGYYTLEVGATNVSTGKKQGEILCFDLAYTSFADKEGIDCLHFLLNDKKELVHGNQLEKIDGAARECGAQVIVSMLRDKLPDDMRYDDAHIVLSLSQDDKLFRM